MLPGDPIERVFVATQVGEILYLDRGVAKEFLDIKSQVIALGTNGGYDERGLLGLAFHPRFYYNGLFYLHYSLANTQGPGVLTDAYLPNPCDVESLNLKWENRDQNYDHIDTVEEWQYNSKNKISHKRRTLLNLIRPFANHNGVNSLNFSLENEKLILITGDGGNGYDPFNLSQNDIEIAGKIIEIDINNNNFIIDPPAVSRFSELPIQIQSMLLIIAKGIRNSVGIAYQKLNDRYIKYVSNVGQNLVESIFSFINYKQVPVTQIVNNNVTLDQPGFINLGWRAWEGILPTVIIDDCPNNHSFETIAFYDEVVMTSATRLPPLVSYFHNDVRPDKFRATALTGILPYMGSAIPELTGSLVFTDLAYRGKSPQRGVIAFTKARTDLN